LTLQICLDANSSQCLLTIGATFNSLAARLKGDGGYFYTNLTKRSKNPKFVLPVELLAMLAWLGVLASLANEGVQARWKKNVDRFVIALTSLVAIQSYVRLILLFSN
jgi:hypothetical protein